MEAINFVMFTTAIQLTSSVDFSVTWCLIGKDGLKIGFLFLCLGMVIGYLVFKNILGTLVWYTEWVII